MTGTVLRGLLARKVRSALTALAVLLGVAMVAGTYVVTDAVFAGLDSIFEASSRNVAAVVAPKTAFDSQVSQLPTVSTDLVDRVRRVEGVRTVGIDVEAYTGQLVVNGKTLGSSMMGAPTMVIARLGPPFDEATDPKDGRMPQRRGEIAVNAATADRHGLRVGQRLGLATAHGTVPVTLVGTFTYGGSSSLVGATAIVAERADVQQWFDLQDRAQALLVAGTPGLDHRELVSRIAAALHDPGLEIKTGEQMRADNSQQVKDAIGRFLKPMLLALAGAALLVGSFIIFNTFSITVAQRTRELGLLRTLGATRRQVLASIALEAGLIGLAAGIAGVVAGLGFARLMGWLFEQGGWSISLEHLTLRPRTIVVGVLLGLVVTLAAALAPALRAMRVPPVAALAGELPAPTRRRRRLRTVSSAAVALLGAGLLVAGVLAGGPATARLSSIGGGAVLLFVGVALSARLVVRPVADVLGWPLRRWQGAEGDLAVENVGRNPARTAITAATLMTGLGLVVFVSVFATGLKASVGDAIDHLLRADVVLRSQTMGPMPSGSAPAAARVPGAAVVAPVQVDEIRLPGRAHHVAVDVVDGVDRRTLERVYDVDWVHGDDRVLARLDEGGAIVEEQFSKTYGIGVGDRFSFRTSAGRRATVRVAGVYRDPMLLQGMMVGRTTFERVSTTHDPWVTLVKAAPGVDPGVLRDRMETALARFPTVEVEDQSEYRDTVTGMMDQMVYLLYALLAMSIVISLFGIANSLALSMHERTREVGMLRAIGATRGQIREVVRYESVITSLIGAVLGMVLGTGIAWLAVYALRDMGVVFAVAPVQLLAFLLVAIVVGVVAAVAPARRSAGADILEALRWE